MCGIAGIFCREPQRLQAIIQSMTTSLSHRGPDDEGFFGKSADGDFYEFVGDNTPDHVTLYLKQRLSLKDSTEYYFYFLMGHRRLSILDVTPAAHQPMADSNNRYWISFNGEIFNYIEIRDELISLGYSFKSNSDTEVILNAYDKWGTECFSRFNGDWALLIYDAITNHLIVSRDRFGVKPLYYYSNGESVVFSSEIKSLLKHPDIDGTFNNDYLQNFLLNGATEWLQETAFDQIYRVPPASFSIINLDSVAAHPQFSKFWNLEINCKQEKFDKKKAIKYSKQYYTLLKDSVRIRLRSDVPFGCALSGGLDSSSIVFLVDEIQRESGSHKPVNTFSLIHSDVGMENYDESEYINLLENFLNLNKFVGSPQVAEVPDLVFKAIESLECPPDGMGVGGLVTTRIAKSQGFVVTLDGQGADEQLAGYESYFENHLQHLSGVTYFVELFFLLKVGGLNIHRLRNIIYSTVPRALKDFINRYLLRRTASDLRDSLPLNQALGTSIDNGLVNLLHYSDGRSMLYSIESRMPFMDHRLVEFNASVPAVYKIYRGWTKYYARLAFEGRLPSEIVWRKDKMGWPIPSREWLNGNLKGWANNIIDQSVLLRKLRIDKSRLVRDNKYLIRILNVAIFESVFLNEGRL